MAQDCFISLKTLLRIVHTYRKEGLASSVLEAIKEESQDARDANDFHKRIEERFKDLPFTKGYESYVQSVVSELKDAAEAEAVKTILLQAEHRNRQVLHGKAPKLNA
mgnify:CR=1 FL=1